MTRMNYGLNHARDLSSRPVDPSKARKAKKKTKRRNTEPFEAKFHGRCSSCGLPWHPQDRIALQPGGKYGHWVCPKPVDNREPLG
jgi:hypothetical protein